MTRPPRAALTVTGLGKRFHHRSTATAPTFRAWVASGFRARRGAAFWALHDVNFSVAPGEIVGVVGRNGSGKSTLLRLLGGVMRADTGQVAALAPINGLLELNTGMHPDLSGRQNIRINGVLAGLLLSEVEERMAAIIDFAELASHIDDPVRSYSSGMKVRLGFSVAVHVDPKILLIDEVLAVGDLGFQQKCLERILEFKRLGCAIVLISHDLGQIRSVCDRAIWLDSGKVAAIGTTYDVTWHYEQAIERARAENAARAARSGGLAVAAGAQTGSGEATLRGFDLLGADGLATEQMVAGSPVMFRARVQANAPVPLWHMSVAITDDEGRPCLDVNTATDEVSLSPMGVESTVTLALDRLDLCAGTYKVSVGLWHHDWTHALDYRRDIARLTITGGPKLKGPLAPPRHWRFQH